MSFNSWLVGKPEVIQERASGKSLLPESGLLLDYHFLYVLREYYVHHFDLSPAPMASFMPLNKPALVRSPQTSASTP
jgi:hypothetical protein